MRRRWPEPHRTRGVRIGIHSGISPPERDGMPSRSPHGLMNTTTQIGGCGTVASDR